MEHDNWKGFNGGEWQEQINVRDFIQTNYTEYLGDEKFLCGATKRTSDIMAQVQQLFKIERSRNGVLDVDTQTISSVKNYMPGYVDKEKEIIVGLQTDSPLKRGVNPFGGMRMARQACSAYGYKISDDIENIFSYKTTHNDGVFSAYNEEMRLARRCHVITGLPDAYGRGRIIGDYRRVALYGVDRLIEEKIKDRDNLDQQPFLEENVKLREELYRQIVFLGYLKRRLLLWARVLALLPERLAVR